MHFLDQICLFLGGDARERVNPFNHIFFTGLDVMFAQRCRRRGYGLSPPGAALSRGEIAGISSGEGLGLACAKVAELTTGEGAGSTAGEGVGLNSGVVVGRTSGEVAGLAAGEAVGRACGEGVLAARKVSFPLDVGESDESAGEGSLTGLTLFGSVSR